MIRGISHTTRRTFFGGAKVKPQPALTEVVTSGIKVSHTAEVKPFQISTLSNGLKVASISNGGKRSTVGFAIRIGSRNETDATRGSAYMLQHTAFKSTTSSSHQRFVRDVENKGVTVTPHACKEVSTFEVTGGADVIDDALPLLADGALNVRLAPWEVEEYSDVAIHALKEAQACPWKSLKDAVGGAAFYPDSALGQTNIYPDGADDVNADAVKGFVQSHLTPSRTAVVGVNVNHATLTRFAEGLSSYFQAGGAAVDVASPYVGGEVRIRKHGASSANVALGFSTGGKKGVSESALEVLKHVVGGANYTNYSDAGVFYVQAFGSTNSKQFLSDSISKLKSLASTGPSAEALAAAKASAKVAVLSATETSAGLFQAVASQVAATGSYAPLNVDAVSADDIKNAAATLLKSKPSVASIGKTSSVPRLSEVASLL